MAPKRSLNGRLAGANDATLLDNVRLAIDARLAEESLLADVHLASEEALSVGDVLLVADDPPPRRQPY